MFNENLKTLRKDRGFSQEQLSVQQNERKNLKKKLVSVATVILFVLFVMAIYDRWNEMFYEFGQSIYYWFH